MSPLTNTLLFFVIFIFIFHVGISWHDYREKIKCKNGTLKQWLHARNELWAWNYENPYASESNPELQKLLQIETGAYMRYAEWWPEKTDPSYLKNLLDRITYQKNS